MNSDPDAHYFAQRTLLGERLKWWRERENLKIEAAALRLGVSTATWGHWETGRTFPSGEMLLTLCSLTELPIHLLFCPHMESCPFHGSDQIPPPDTDCCQNGSSAAPEQSPPP